MSTALLDGNLHKHERIYRHFVVVVVDGRGIIVRTDDATRLTQL